MTAIDLKRFGLFLGIWLVLTRGEPVALAAGIPVALAAAALAHRVARQGERPLRLSPLVALFPGFVWRSFLGGLDVAWRAALPSLPLKPGWLRHESHLPEGTARVALASTISLMPGTLAAGEEKGVLLVHCLDTDADMAAAVSAEEQRLRGVFDA